MAFSWVSPGRTEEAGCNEAPYLVVEGGIRRVTRGQLGRNNESFLFLSVSVSWEDGGSSGNFFLGGDPERGSLETKSSTLRKRAGALQIFNTYARTSIQHTCCSSVDQQWQLSEIANLKR